MLMCTEFDMTTIGANGLLQSRHSAHKHGFPAVVWRISEKSFHIVKKFFLRPRHDILQPVLRGTEWEKVTWSDIGRIEWLGRQGEVVGLDELPQGFRVVRVRIVQMEPTARASNSHDAESEGMNQCRDYHVRERQ
jgi:hypothetical protein